MLVQVHVRMQTRMRVGVHTLSCSTWVPSGAAAAAAQAAQLERGDLSNCVC